MMNRKTMLLAVAALSVVALAALPSMASAFTTTPVMTLAKYPAAFTSTGGAGTFYSASGRKVTCESATGAGSVTDPHTISLKTTLGGCKESILGTKCTTAGQTAGTITTETLPAHTLYGKPTNAGNPHETPDYVITHNEATGKFAEFSCAGGLVKIVVKGSGVLGTVTEPIIGGGESNTAKIKVSATEAGQEHTESQEGEKFGLESSTNGGALEPSYLNAGTDTVTLAEGAKGKTTTATP